MPYQRLIRSHMSADIINILGENSEIAIVSPFAEVLCDVAEHRKLNINHYISFAPESRNKIANFLYKFSTFLRIRGYWYKNRKKIPYYWQNRFRIFRAEGQDKQIYKIFCPIMDALSWLSQESKIWKIFDNIHGNYTYKFKSIELLAINYKKIIILQSASWGYQDTALAWMAKKNGWKSILIPYGTDQLYCNGHLLNNYERVLVQGDSEKEWAQKLHNINIERIVEFGSLNARVINEKIIRNDFARKSNLNKQIMYAGVSSTYFSREIEVETVLLLSEWILNNLGKEWLLIYRPVYSEGDWMPNAEFPENILIQRTNQSLIGLTTYENTSVDSDILLLINQLKVIDILITSVSTSLVIDASILGVPSIAYYPRDDKMLNRRSTELMFNKLGKLIDMEELPVARSFNDVTKFITDVVYDEQKKINISESIKKKWDYPDSDFEKILKKLMLNI